MYLAGTLETMRACSSDLDAYHNVKLHFGWARQGRPRTFFPGRSNMSNLAPWARTDLLEFPKEARMCDLDILLDQAEADVAPGRHYWLGFGNRPLPGSAETTSTSLVELPPGPVATDTDMEATYLANRARNQARLTPRPAVLRPTRQARMTGMEGLANSQVATQPWTPLAPPVRGRERSPAPKSAKRQRANPTKADWETMDCQDTESE